MACGMDDAMLPEYPKSCRSLARSKESHIRCCKRFRNHSLVHKLERNPCCNHIRKLIRNRRMVHIQHCNQCHSSWYRSRSYVHPAYGWSKSIAKLWLQRLAPRTKEPTSMFHFIEPHLLIHEPLNWYFDTMGAVSSGAGFQRTKSPPKSPSCISRQRATQFAGSHRSTSLCPSTSFLDR